MQKKIVATGIAALLVLVASAQGGEEVPAPPAPPKPPATKMKNLPPPPPPEAPTPPDAAPPQTEEFDAFMKRNLNVSAVDVHNDRVTVRLKSGAKEKYDLEEEGSRKAFVSKYGELPSPPPPPPPPPPAPAPPSKHGKKKSISL